MIIIISGKQGSGKTTLAKALASKLADAGYCPHAIKIAEPLYKMHNAVLNILQEYGVKRNIEKDGPLLQLLGEEWGRKTLNPAIWSQLAAEKVRQILDDSRRDSVYSTRPAAVVIDDIRFQNELDAFEDAYKIRLECDRDVRKERCSAWRDNETHPSETDLDAYADRDSGEFDCYINTEVSSSSEYIDQIIADAKLLLESNTK